MTKIQSLDINYLKKIAERVKQEKENPPVEQKPIIQPVSIKQNNDCWTMQGIMYKGRFGDVDISKHWIANREFRTQDSWASYSELAKRNGNFYTPDFHLLYGTLQRAFCYKNEPPYEDEIEELRNFIQAASRGKSIVTLTKVRYLPAPQGDIIIHNQDITDGCFTYSEDVVGENGPIPIKDYQRLYKGLVGEGGVKTINEVSQWFNKTPAVIARLNSKPKEIEERVGLFYTTMQSVYFSFTGVPNNTYPSLGFRFNEYNRGGSQ